MRVRPGIDDENVRQAFEFAATKATDPFYAFYHRIEWELTLGFLDTVRRDVQRALRFSPGRAHELLHIAQKLFEGGKCAGSEAILDEIIDAGLDLGSKKVMWASLKLDAGLTDARVEQVLVKAANGPDPFWAHYHCIRLYALRCDEASVDTYVIAALNLAPLMVSTLVELAKEQFNYGRGGVALAILEPMSKLNVDWGNGHLIWASLRIDVDRIDADVETTLLQEVQKAHSFWSFYHCIRMYCRKGDVLSVSKLVANALVQYPKMSTHLIALAEQEFSNIRASSSLAILDVIVQAVKINEADRRAVN